jgi:flagellar motor switch/type III secretory pathway protein FliN
MIYDVGEYEKQLRKIRKQVRRNREGLRPGEYLYGFREKDKLKPVVTFLLYAGEEPWEHPSGLNDILDFTDIPVNLRDKIPNYKINVIDIRRMKDTSVFQTDIAEVFDFIRYSNDKDKLKELVESKSYFQHMEEDAFDVAVNYSCAQELGFAKEEYEEGGRVNMCVAIQEMMKDSKAEGILEGRREGRREGVLEGRREGVLEGRQQIVRNMLLRGMPDEDIMAIAECDKQFIDEIKDEIFSTKR